MKKNDAKGIEVLKKEKNKQKASVTDLIVSLKKMQKESLPGKETKVI